MPTSSPRARAHAAWRIDAVLAIAVAALIAVVISAEQGGRVDPDAVAYLWAVGLGGLMLVRRRYPVLVVAISVLGLFAYYAAGYPAVGVAVPVAAALYSAAEMDRLPAAVVAGAGVLAVSVAFRLAEGQSVSYVVGYELAGHVLLVAAAIALGDAVRSRRQVARDAERVLEAATERERHATERAAHATRTAIARDLHDAIGHSTVVISLHADVAREALGPDDATALGALDVITATSRSMMTELRRTVRLLRSPEVDSVGARSLSELASAPLVGLGADVSTDIRLPGGVPSEVEDVAFRIVQESLTNVVRHADASHVRIEVADRDGVLHVAVVDDGNGGPPPDDAQVVPRGHGIVGMQERVQTVGGTLTARREAAGFAVRACLPWRGRT